MGGSEQRTGISNWSVLAGPLCGCVAWTDSANRSTLAAGSVVCEGKVVLRKNSKVFDLRNKKDGVAINSNRKLFTVGFGGNTSNSLVYVMIMGCLLYILVAMSSRKLDDKSQAFS